MPISILFLLVVVFLSFAAMIAARVGVSLCALSGLLSRQPREES